jgi:hypothetical protein
LCCFCFCFCLFFEGEQFNTMLQCNLPLKYP